MGGRQVGVGGMDVWCVECEALGRCPPPWPLCVQEEEERQRLAEEQRARWVVTDVPLPGWLGGAASRFWHYGCKPLGRRALRVG